MHAPHSCVAKRVWRRAPLDVPRDSAQTAANAWSRRSNPSKNEERAHPPRSRGAGRRKNARVRDERRVGGRQRHGVRIQETRRGALRRRRKLRRRHGRRKLHGVRLRRRRAVGLRRRGKAGLRRQRAEVHRGRRRDDNGVEGLVERRGRRRAHVREGLRRQAVRRGGGRREDGRRQRARLRHGQAERHDHGPDAPPDGDGGAATGYDPPQRRVHDPGRRERGRGQAGRRGRARGPRRQRGPRRPGDLRGVARRLRRPRGDGRGPRGQGRRPAHVARVDDIFQRPLVPQGRPRLGRGDRGLHAGDAARARVPGLERRRRDRLRQPPGELGRRRRRRRDRDGRRRLRPRAEELGGDEDRHREGRRVHPRDEARLRDDAHARLDRRVHARRQGLPPLRGGGRRLHLRRLRGQAEVQGRGQERDGVRGRLRGLRRRPAWPTPSRTSATPKCA